MMSKPAPSAPKIITGQPILLVKSVDGLPRKSSTIIFALDTSTSNKWGADKNGENQTDAYRRFITEAERLEFNTFAAGFGLKVMAHDGKRLTKRDPRMTLMPGPAYVEKFFSSKSKPSLPKKAQLVRTNFISMGFHNVDLVDQAIQKFECKTDLQAMQAYDWLFAQKDSTNSSDTKSESFGGEFFMGATYPDNILYMLKDYNVENDSRFILVIAGDGQFTTSLDKILGSCAQKGLLDNCAHVILSVPPEAPDQMESKKNGLVDRAHKMFDKLREETSEIMKQAPSAVFTAIPGFDSSVSATIASDMSPHLFNAIARNKTGSYLSYPGYMQLGGVLVKQSCTQKALSECLAHSLECREEVKILLTGLTTDTVSVLWENSFVWGRLWAAVKRLEDQALVLYKNAIQNHISNLCSRLEGAEREQADAFFETSQQDDLFFEELVESLTKDPTTQRDYAIVLKEGAEKQKAKALNYRPEEFHKEALPLLAKLLRNNISVVSKDEVEQSFVAPFNPGDDPEAVKVCSLLLSVLSQSSASYGASTPAVLMYMVAQGFHDDKRIEPPLRSLIFQAANSDVCKKFVSKIHLLEDKNEEERPAAQLGGEARAKYLFERQKLAPYVGSSFVFTALRYSSAVALPEKTRAIYGNLAKAYLMGKELRSNRAVLKLNTKIQNPVDGKVAVQRQYKLAMLIAFERDEDGLLLPVVFRPGKPRVNLFRIRRLLNSPDRTSIEEILEKQANHQILTYAIDLQIREFATQHDGISSEQTIRKVWDMFTGLGLQVTNEENNDVVAQQYSLISHLCYEKPTVGTDKQKKMAEEKIKSEKLAILGSLGQGSYTEANVTKDFTMAELIATITPSTMEEIVGLSKHTLQVVRDQHTGAYARAKQMVALTKMDPVLTGEARMKEYQIVLPHPTARSGVQKYKVKGLELAGLFDIKLPGQVTAFGCPPDYVCLYCCSLRFEGGVSDYKLSCCQNHACLPCLATSLKGVFIKGQRVNRGIAKCTNCYQFITMQDMKVLAPKTADMFQTLSNLLIKEQPPLKDEAKLDLVEALGKAFYVPCDAHECDQVFNAGPYDCNAHGFFTSCPKHRLDKKDVKKCPNPVCNKEWGPPLFCHHATCETSMGGCGAHWCWTCTGNNWPGEPGKRYWKMDGDEIYAHMTHAHGGWHGGI